jgi:type II secretory pathway pseudopilin PulG
MTRRHEQGDTIIEIVIAFAIFALAAVSTLIILNKGVATTQRNLEATLVRQQVDSQAELIRYIHDSRGAAWATMLSKVTTNPAPISSDGPTCPTTTDISTGFYVRPTINADPKATTFAVQGLTATTYTNTPQTYAKIDYTTGAPKAEGIWVQVAEAENDTGSGIKAYDFYIHACWDSVGLNIPMTLGTVVRLYAE